MFKVAHDDVQVVRPFLRLYDKTHWMRSICRIAVKSYGAYHLYSVIGHLEHLDAALNVLLLVDASYGAPNLDIVIGQLEPVNTALYALWILNKRIAVQYRVEHLDYNLKLVLFRTDYCSIIYFSTEQ